MIAELEAAIDSLLSRPSTSTLRLQYLAFEIALRKLAIRKAPLWNQGLMEGLWFIRFDSTRPSGKRIVDPAHAEQEGGEFIRSLLCELRLREPAVELTKPLDCPGQNSMIG